MKRNLKSNQLELWKSRQIKEGYDVSAITTIEEAKAFNLLSEKKKKQKRKKETIEVTEGITEEHLEVKEEEEAEEVIK